MRHVAVDVETTGLDPNSGDRVISVGCVELVERQFTGRDFHRLIDPQRTIPAESSRVHGIRDHQVAGQPKFAELAEEFLAFVRGAHLLGHNIEFDLGFLDAELQKARRKERLGEICDSTCTLKMARARYPSRRNNLDALSLRLGVASSERGYHDALEDARLTAFVWLRMTMGQGELSMSEEAGGGSKRAIDREGLELVRFEPGAEDLEAHEKMLRNIDAKSEWGAAWLKEFKET
ncbi:MAG: DNA polymerase III subunit epsilon [Gammaproteobacteria bacterium]|nr:DNA polymerase III subunit epsilon [Gammaproteobacteria bacterium]